MQILGFLGSLCHLHHLLLQQQWFDILAPAYPSCYEILAIKRVLLSFLFTFLQICICYFFAFCRNSIILKAICFEATGPQQMRATAEYLEKRSGVRNGDSRIQVQLEEDGGGGSRQNWMEKSGLWSMLHWEHQDISQVKSIMLNDSTLLVW